MDIIKNELKNIFSEIVTNIKRYYPFLIVFFLYLISFYIFDPTGSNCLVQRTIHLPCPMCGMTRASVALFQLRFVDAFRWHPLVYIMPLLFCTFFLQGYRMFSKIYNSKIFWGIVIGLFIVVYIIRMILFFPHTEPMVPHY